MKRKVADKDKEFTTPYWIGMFIGTMLLVAIMLYAILKYPNAPIEDAAFYGWPFIGFGTIMIVGVAETIHRYRNK
jgi:hypothetical protein